MDPETFRRCGHQTIDWIADYLARVDSLPVRPAVKPGDIRRMLPASPPERGEPFNNLLADLDRIVTPGLLNWQSPRFFGWFPSNATGASVLADLVSSGLGVQGMLWASSPACTEVETHMLDWLAELLGLPAQFKSPELGGTAGGGVIQDTASSATLCAIVAARERATALASDTHGLRECPQRLVAYASTEAHSHVEKDVRIAGLGKAALRLVPTDQHGAMDPAALAHTIADDQRAGFTPFFLCATLGTTSTHAFDPLRAIGHLCRQHGIWMHVDAAHAGVAAICPEFRWMNDGVELADSYCTNPHKWLGANFDLSAFWVADRAALIRALTVQPEYLRNAASSSGAAIDYRDWQVPLGRRFRALKLWWLVRHEGAEGIRRRIRLHVELAQCFRALVESDARFEVLAPTPLSLVCFALRAGDAPTEALLQRANDTGRIFITHTRIRGRYAIRLAIGQTTVTEQHVLKAWELLHTLASAQNAR